MRWYCETGRLPWPGRYHMSASGIAAAALYLSLCATAGSALAQADWAPELAPPAAETRSSREPIVILLPDGLDPATFGRLAVELDDLDVTAFADIASGSLTLVPPEALGTGTHSLRLSERGDDGSILERGAWALEIRHSAFIRDLSLDADLDG